MTLTIKQIYDRYSVRTFTKKIEIKRKISDLIYEDDWQDIVQLSGLTLFDDSIATISQQCSNTNYNFGVITSGNVVIKLNSKNGQFDDENNSSSIFKGFIRHGSLIRIRFGYIDNYTDINNPVDVLQTVFYGFIDAIADASKVDENNLIQNLQLVDCLSFLLKSYTISDVGPLISTTINDLILEILDRDEFTTFFNVDEDNINAAYNIESFDISQYEGQTQLFTLFENFSLGHSYYYLNNEIFYYGSLISGQENTLEINQKKTIKFSAYNSGAKNVYDRFYWQDDDSISFVASPLIYNRSKTIEIKGVLNSIQRLNLLNTCGNIAKVQKKQFNLIIPCYMIINIMDKIVVDSPANIPSDAFIWGISNWGEKKWRKSQQADSIPNKIYWVVKSLKHNPNLTTELLLEEVIV
jgi:hypothetical protein